MDRPFVVCHMLTSLDGKIDGAFFGAPETAPALRAYADLRGVYACQATLYGTTTMRGGYADGDAPALPAARGEVPAEWINPEGRKMGNFLISLDPGGELGFSSHVLEKKGRPAAHVIEALTAQASPAYLAYLRRLGISYVFAGDKLLYQRKRPVMAPGEMEQVVFQKAWFTGGEAEIRLVAEEEEAQ